MSDSPQCGHRCPKQRTGHRRLEDLGSRLTNLDSYWENVGEISKEWNQTTELLNFGSDCLPRGER